jgi:hypothetical protein
MLQPILMHSTSAYIQDLDTNVDSCVVCLRCCVALQFEDAARVAAVANMDDEEVEQSIVDGLSFLGGTEEALQAPKQQPVEWTPEVGLDSRVQAQSAETVSFGMLPWCDVCG